MRTPPVIGAVIGAALLALGACSDDSTDSSAVGSGTSAPSAETPSASSPSSASPSSASPPSASPPTSPSARTKKPTASGTTIKIRIRGGSISPNGNRVKVKTGEPITLQIDADTPGELHVHSTPEQEIAFDKGRSTRKLTIEQPGIVDVEEHELEQVTVQLEAS